MTTANSPTVRPTPVQLAFARRRSVEPIRADDPAAQEHMSPYMGPSVYSYDPNDLSVTAPIEEDVAKEHAVRSMHVLQYHDDLFDIYYQESTPFYTNLPFFALVQGMDADAHQYLERVNIWSIPDGRLRAEAYKGIWVRRLVPTIDVKRSRVDKVEWHRAIIEPPNHKPYRYSLKALTPEGMVVYRRALDTGLSIWRDRDTRALFCTKEFRARALEVGARGLEFSECTVVDR
jgi:hypothetical protein